MFYTGIGSRHTPNHILGQMIKIAYFLNTHEFTLRSGGADGADSAFEAGVDRAPNPTLKEIYLPYQNFNNRRSALFPPSDRAYQLAEKYHPRWHKLSPVVKALMARNTHQVLGQDLNTPSAFTVCYTLDGQDSGGTGQALRLCRDLDIPVFNLYNSSTLEKLNAFLRGLHGQT